jgi:hypothetical protein
MSGELRYDQAVMTSTVRPSTDGRFVLIPETSEERAQRERERAEGAESRMNLTRGQVVTLYKARLRSTEAQSPAQR